MSEPENFVAGRWSEGSAAVTRSCIVCSRCNLRDGALQVGNDRLEGLLFFRVEGAQRGPHRADGEAVQLTAELDRLHELAAVQEVHQRQHRGHNPAAFVEVLFQNAGLVERYMLPGKEVGAGADPAPRPPGKELKSLIVPAA